MTSHFTVKNYLTPLLKSSLFRDQYAYKPTGFTVCALVDFTYRIRTLLESNRYVRCVLIDFSKAFDMVDHVILARKLFRLQVPVFIIHWIMSFLSDRTHKPLDLAFTCLRSCPLTGQSCKVIVLDQYSS